MPVWLILTKVIKIKLAVRKLKRAKLNAYRKNIGLSPIYPWYEAIVRFICRSFKYIFLRACCWCLIRKGKNETISKWDALWTSGTLTNSILISFTGLLCGLFFTHLITIFLIFELNISPYLATYGTMFFGVFLTLGLAFSETTRLFVFLTVPQFFTKKGRAAILAYAIILAVSGPGKNTTRNMEILTESVICTQEMAKNATAGLVRLVKDPLTAIGKAMKTIIETVKEVANNIKGGLMHLMKVIKSIVNVILFTYDWLKKIVEVCNNKVGTPFDRCWIAFDEAIEDCKYQLGVLLSWMCNVVNIFQHICYVTKVVDLLCWLPSLVNDVIFKPISKLLKNFMESVKTFFDVNIIASHKFDHWLAPSKKFKEIIHDMKAEVTGELQWLITYFDWMDFLVSIFLFLALYKAIIYRHRFLNMDRFDNFYITKGLVKLDWTRKRVGKQIIFPLSYRESRLFVQTFSFAMIKEERTKLRNSVVLVTLGATQILSYMLLDFGLFLFLEVLRRHGLIRLDTRNLLGYNIKITGTGFMADMYRAILKALSPIGGLLPVFDTSPCLPIPLIPDYIRYSVLVLLILFCYLATLTEPYLMRLRHIICGIYYPERKNHRDRWLYTHIMNSKGTFVNFARSQLKARLIGDKVVFRISLMDRLSHTIPGWRYLVSYFGKKKKQCFLCGRKGDLDDFENFFHCPICEAIYCMECFTELGKKCPAHNNVFDSSGEISEEKGSSDFSGDENPKSKTKRALVKLPERKVFFSRKKKGNKPVEETDYEYEYEYEMDDNSSMSESEVENERTDLLPKVKKLKIKNIPETDISQSQTSASTDKVKPVTPSIFSLRTGVSSLGNKTEKSSLSSAKKKESSQVKSNQTKKMAALPLKSTSFGTLLSNSKKIGMNLKDLIKGKGKSKNYLELSAKKSETSTLLPKQSDREDYESKIPSVKGILSSTKSKQLINKLKLRKSKSISPLSKPKSNQKLIKSSKSEESNLRQRFDGTQRDKLKFEDEIKSSSKSSNYKNIQKLSSRTPLKSQEESAIKSSSNSSRQTTPPPPVPIPSGLKQRAQTDMLSLLKQNQIENSKTRTTVEKKSNVFSESEEEALHTQGILTPLTISHAKPRRDSKMQPSKGKIKLVSNLEQETPRVPSVPYDSGKQNKKIPKKSARHEKKGIIFPAQLPATDQIKSNLNINMQKVSQRSIVPPPMQSNFVEDLTKPLVLVKNESKNLETIQVSPSPKSMFHSTSTPVQELGLGVPSKSKTHLHLTKPTKRTENFIKLASQQEITSWLNIASRPETLNLHPGDENNKSRFATTTGILYSTPQTSEKVKHKDNERIKPALMSQEEIHSSALVYLKPVPAPEIVNSTTTGNLISKSKLRTNPVTFSSPGKKTNFLTAVEANSSKTEKSIITSQISPTSQLHSNPVIVHQSQKSFKSDQKKEPLHSSLKIQLNHTASIHSDSEIQSKGKLQELPHINPIPVPPPLPPGKFWLTARPDVVEKSMSREIRLIPPIPVPGLENVPNPESGSTTKQSLQDRLHPYKPVPTEKPAPPNELLPDLNRSQYKFLEKSPIDKSISNQNQTSQTRIGANVQSIRTKFPNQFRSTYEFAPQDIIPKSAQSLVDDQTQHLVNVPKMHTLSGILTKTKRDSIKKQVTFSKCPEEMEFSSDFNCEKEQHSHVNSDFDDLRTSLLTERSCCENIIIEPDENEYEEETDGLDVDGICHHHQSADDVVYDSYDEVLSEMESTYAEYPKEDTVDKAKISTKSFTNSKRSLCCGQDDQVKLITPRPLFNTQCRDNRMQLVTPVHLSTNVSPGLAGMVQNLDKFYKEKPYPPLSNPYNSRL